MEQEPNDLWLDEIREHAGFLQRLARSLVRDEHVAEDLVQDAWLAALQGGAGKRVSPRHWFARVLRNASINRALQERRRRQREHEAGPEQDVPGPQVIEERLELEQRVVAAVKELPAANREAIYLRYFEDLGVEEIARRLALPVATVASRLARGKQLLRERLRAEFGVGRDAWALIAFGPGSMVSRGKTPASLMKVLMASKINVVSAIALLSIVAAVAWFFGMDSWRSSKSADPEAEDSIGLPGAQLAADRRDAAPGGDAREALLIAKDGSLSLSIVESQDGQPLPGVHFRIYATGLMQKLLVEGDTDELGHARIRNLPRETLVVRTERRPPQAEGFGFLDFRPSNANDFTLRVGRGGSIRGRVVDGSGRAMEGVSIFLAKQMPAFGESERIPPGAEPVATTNGRGAFRVDHVLTRIVEARLVAGRSEPQRWNPVLLKAQNPFDGGVFDGKAVALVEEGQVVQLAQPLVVQADQVLSGRVLTGGGEAAAGVFVTPSLRCRPELRRVSLHDDLAVLPNSPGPWEKQLSLTAHEAITDANGRFQLQVPMGSSYDVLTVARSGVVERFEGVLDSASFAGPTQVELHLREPTVLSFVLGVAPWGVELEDGVVASAAPWSGESTRVDDTELVLSSGDVERHPWLPVGRDGVLKLVARADPSEIRAVKVKAGSSQGTRTGNGPEAGFLVARGEFPAGVDPLGLHVLEVARYSPLALTIGPLAGLEPVGLEDFQLVIRACTASPRELEQRTQKPLAEAPLSGTRGCCGMGYSWFGNWDEQQLRLDLPVRSRFPYWLYVEGNSRSHSLPLQVFGPFLPGKARHEVTLDTGGLVDHEVLAAQAVGQPSKDTVFGPRAIIGVSIIDSGTGEELQSARLELISETGARSSGNGIQLRAAAAGLVGGTTESGHYRLRLKAEGYTSVELGTQHLVLGETLALGVIEMSPADHFRIQLLEADGTPVQEGTDAVICRRERKVGAGGLLTVKYALPPAFPIGFKGQSSDQLRVVEVAAWSAGEIVQATLPELRQVEFVIHGVPPEYEFASMTVVLRSLMEHEPLYTEDYYPNSWHTAGYLRVRERASYKRAGKLFVAGLGLGPYSVELESALFPIPPTKIEVTAGTGAQVIDLSAPRLR